MYKRRHSFIVLRMNKDYTKISCVVFKSHAIFQSSGQNMIY